MDLLSYIHQGNSLVFSIQIVYSKGKKGESNKRRKNMDNLAEWMEDKRIIPCLLEKEKEVSIKADEN